ncbi:uncharacterized protein BDZ83DRAFT_154014 [Colletotrichum acutatum]|uniref:Uncharacterized protein n=1 Tax=Glomerella acutata TaxID=27357 RepID=A0AAD8U967_GLOAC|nr:uncharacterized protein BDZ83DRAFT_154014 [Colletotrichum acutatum]KAK1708696.1 hypothetical protein BDZ83DRAFT_154014 [Colletotrichum acutatum]
MPMPCLSSSLSMPCSHPIHIEVPHCPSPRLHPIPSHPIHAPRPIPSHHASSLTHPSPIPTVQRCGPQSAVHNSRTAPSTEKKEGSNKKKSQDPGGYIKKEPLCPTRCIFHLKSSVQPLLWYCCCIRALCPHLRWRLMNSGFG